MKAGARLRKKAKIAALLEFFFMKTRLLAIGLAGLSAALVACGGGGGGGNGTPPTSAPQPTPTPTPYAYGDSMNYSGSQTTAVTFAYPSPSPYPSTNTTATVTQAVTVSASANPYGPAGAGDFHTVETDAQPLVSHTTTTDAWIGVSGTNLVEYGYNSADDSGDKLGARYTTPFIMDAMPETNGASWSNTAGVTYTEKDADGTQSSRVYAANGTYTETTSNSNIGINTTLTENADGSGSIMANGFYLGGNVDNIAISAPVNNAVTVTVNYVQPPTPTPAPTGQPSPTPGPTFAPLVYTAPAWYGTSAPVFYSQKTTVTIGVTYPAGCAVPSSYGTSGNQITQSTDSLDTILGYTDTQTQTTYTSSTSGPVCIVISDVQNDYYDYQDDFAAANGFHFHFPGTSLSTTSTSETLTLQPGAVVKTASLMARVASATAAVRLRAERARHARETKFLHHLAVLAHKGVR